VLQQGLLLHCQEGLTAATDLQEVKQTIKRNSNVCHWLHAKQPCFCRSHD
jgi:hypothetical protein